MTVNLLSDRELLELAAKAAGFHELSEWSESISDFDSPHFNGPALHDKGNQFRSWNPLQDDGDAFRLMVKLDLLIDIEGGSSFASYGDSSVWEIHDSDPCAATRRAIVRAAAEIGGRKAI